VPAEKLKTVLGIRQIEIVPAAAATVSDITLA
jgi:hypothetical protein